MHKIKFMALGLVIATGSLIVTGKQAQAAFLDGAFSGFLNNSSGTLPFDAKTIRTDGGNFSFANANLLVLSTGRIPGRLQSDFLSLDGSNTGIYYGITYTQTGNIIPAQAWNYSGQTTTPSGLLFEFANFQGSGNTLTFTAFDNPTSYVLNNGSMIIPFSGTFTSQSINGVFSVAGFDDTAGTVSLSCTYSQNNVGPNPDSASCNASFAALGVQPRSGSTSTPEPGSILGLLAVAGLAGMSALKKVRK